MEKIANATIFLQDELSNARMCCEELKRDIVKALTFIEDSTKRDHFYAVAGDIIKSIPDGILKLEKSLSAAAMVVNKVDYEEQRQILRPEKIDQLEEMLDNIRMKMPKKKRVLVPKLTNKAE